VASRRQTRTHPRPRDGSASPAVPPFFRPRPPPACPRRGDGRVEAERRLLPVYGPGPPFAYCRPPAPRIGPAGHAGFSQPLRSERPGAPQAGFQSQAGPLCAPRSRAPSPSSPCAVQTDASSGSARPIVGVAVRVAGTRDTPRSNRWSQTSARMTLASMGSPPRHPSSPPLSPHHPAWGPGASTGRRKYSTRSLAVPNRTVCGRFTSPASVAMRSDARLDTTARRRPRPPPATLPPRPSGGGR
jgi:hypothetical protein